MTIDLKSFNNRIETQEALEKLNKKELHEIAEELELIGHKSWNKETLIRKIVWFGRVVPMSFEYFRNLKIDIYTGIQK